MTDQAHDWLAAPFVGDLARLLAATGSSTGAAAPDGSVRPAEPEGTAHGTTVIAVKFREGVINLGDRRATAESFILYDRADKILRLDDFTLIGISGSYARAMDVVRFLKHSFSYYRRSQLQEMSLEGKLGEVARVIGGNVVDVLAGGGVVIPLLSTYDRQRNEGRLFFYDAAGARFESQEFGAAGSGSFRIRGAFDYIVRTKGPFHEMAFEQALNEALVLLGIAAELDAATAGFQVIPPTVKVITQEGIRAVEGAELKAAIEGLASEAAPSPPGRGLG